MKSILLSLSLLGTLGATETVFPIVETKVRTMRYELGLGFGFNFNITSADGINSTYFPTFAARENTWMKFEKNGADCVFMVSDNRLVWKMKKGDVQVAGSQFFEFAGDGAKFEQSHVFKERKQQKRKKVSERAVLLEVIPIDLKLPIGDVTNALAWKGSLKLYFDGADIVVKQELSEKKLRYNIGLPKGDEGIWYIESDLAKQVRIDVFNISTNLLSSSKGVKQYKLKYEYQVLAPVRYHFSKPSNMVVSKEELQKILPFVKEGYDKGVMTTERSDDINFLPAKGSIKREKLVEFKLE